MVNRVIDAEDVLKKMRKNKDVIWHIATKGNLSHYRKRYLDNLLLLLV